MNYLLILTVLFLTACSETEEKYCNRIYDPVSCVSVTSKDNTVFEMCLSKLAEMRGSKGGNYTTNDDEDLDDAIDSCRYASVKYQMYQTECFPNPQYVEQQKFCSLKGE